MIKKHPDGLGERHRDAKIKKITYVLVVFFTINAKVTMT